MNRNGSTTTTTVADFNISADSVMVINTSDVLETYVYRMGISGSQYGLSTAAGLFKSVISILLVAIGNKLSKKLTGEEVL